jgi:hypothetical protein
MHIRTIKILFFLILFTLVNKHLIAQNNQRCITIDGTKTIFCDTLTIEPSTIFVTEGITFQFNAVSNCINLTSETTGEICYKVFPFKLDNPYFNRSTDLIDTTGGFDFKSYFDRTRNQATYLEKREEIFSSPGLNKTGNITRGISFGNTQNVFVNSSLNLQLQGNLTEDVKLTAAISDQNVPFQPEGNTQQLQEFERVYIQLEHKRAKLLAGDLTIQNRPSQFLRYNKNVQGAGVEVYSSLKDSIHSTTFGEVAVAKGRFYSLNVTPLEGVLGPYRLNGPNGEKFITVLANSEKVWVDGNLMMRGFNYDYVIDYNSAEITFTNKVLITKFTRVRVDFEYTDRNYGRTVYSAGHNQQFNKGNAYIHVFNEADNPRNPLVFKLEDKDKLYLSTIGDTLSKAFISGVDSADEFNGNQVFYERIDSITASGTFPVFVYSTDSTKQLWILSFTEVGMGMGNYIQINSTINGRVFKWVAPQNGIPQGNYEPIRLIQTPKKRQMVVLGSNYELSQTDVVFAEIAYSVNDINMYSKADSYDNQGFAFKTGYINKGKNINFLKNYKLLNSVDVEFDNKYFLPMDRYRTIEYERDWQSDNIFDNATQIPDLILNAGVGVEKNNANKVAYNFSRRKRGSDVNGTQHQAQFNQEFRNFRWRSDFFKLDNDREKEVSDWTRFMIEPSYQIKTNIVGYNYKSDKNILRSKTSESDSVISSLMNFDEHTFFARSIDTAKVGYRLDYSNRFDNLPIEGQLVRTNHAQTANGGINTKMGTGSLGITGTYRNLKYLLPADSGKFDETIMGRTDWVANLFKRHIISELTYIAGSGRELKRQYIYLPVPVGTGTHNWIDFNNDGLQDLNEFVEATNFDQRKFIKFFVPTNEYIAAYTNNMNYRLNVFAPREWRKKKGIKNIISRLSNTTAWNVDKKITDKSVLQRFSPFTEGVNNDNLISASENLRSSFFFNRTSPKYGIEYSILKTFQKQLLQNGIDTRRILEHRLNPRANIGKFFSAKITTIRSFREYTSEFLAQRNYLIDNKSVIPELAFQPSNDIRFSINYGYSEKINALKKDTLAETALQQELGVEIRWSKVSNRLITFTGKYINIDFKHGELNSQLAFDMLDALAPGNNFTWNLTWQQKLVNGLQVNISYEGRKTETNKAVHIGRMQVSALF